MIDIDNSEERLLIPGDVVPEGGAQWTWCDSLSAAGRRPVLVVRIESGNVQFSSLFCYTLTMIAFDTKEPDFNNKHPRTAIIR